VYYKQVSSGKKLTIDINTSVKWIISVMNYNTEIFEKLELMFRSLDSYYQTANFGRHSIKLTEFLHKLVSAFVGKLHRERYRKRRKFWGSRPPPEKMVSISAMKIKCEHERHNCVIIIKSCLKENYQVIS
jgi:hypothetical protein